MLNITRIKRIFRSLFASEIKRDLTILKQEASQDWTGLTFLIEEFNYIQDMRLERVINQLEQILQKWSEKKDHINTLKINLESINYGQYVNIGEALSDIISISVITLDKIQNINLEERPEESIRKDMEKSIRFWMVFLKKVLGK
jgi:hypothetical protein